MPGGWKMKRLVPMTLIWGLVTTLLCSCTTPRHQLSYRYDPPGDAAGQACLRQCEQSQQVCFYACRARHENCVRDLEPEVRQRYNDALARYADEMAQYQRDLDSYYLSLSLGWGYHDGWYGAGWYTPYWPYGGYRPYYAAPVPPQPPSYADELTQLRAQRCDRDCACQPEYDACFLSCGGSKTLQQRCFAHCPPYP